MSGNGTTLLLKGDNKKSPTITIVPKIEISEASDGPNSPKILDTIAGDPLPRRLSKLFSPLNKDELKEEESEKNEESSELLPDSAKDPRNVLVLPTSQRRRSSIVLSSTQRRRSAVTARIPGIKFLDRRKSTEGNAVKKLDKLEEGQNDSEASNQSSSESSDSSDEADEDDPKDGTSWDDTICSNRSAYFKLYYQRNFANLKVDENKSKGSTRASSMTSLASLIREKNKMKPSINVKKKKKREDIGLMILVIFLFLVLIIGISLIYYFYHQHLEEMSLFMRLKFNEEDRLLELTDSRGNLVVLSELGKTLPKYSKAEDCTNYLLYLQKKAYLEEQEEDILMADASLKARNASDVYIKQKRNIDEFQFDNETVCLDWANLARVQIHKAHSRDYVSCYYVYWSSHNLGVLKDCVIISGNDVGVWWGIGEISGGGYPLESTRLEPTLYETEELSQGTWGQVLRRSFLSSKGGLVTLPNHLSAIISIENHNQLCISVNTSQQVNPTLPTTLNYTICSSPKLSSILDYLHFSSEAKNNTIINSNNNGNTYFINNTREEIKDIILKRIETPIWIPYLEQNNPTLSQETVLEYAEKITSENYSDSGYILLPLSWQSTLGELTFDINKFPDPENMTESLREKGLQLALTLSPIISTETEAFNNGTKEGWWVLQQDSSLPILIPFDGIVAGALVDFTNTKASDWFLGKLTDLRDTYGINTFHLTYPDSGKIPKHHDFHSGVRNPDTVSNLYLKTVSTISPPLNTEMALSPPLPPTFVSIGSEKSGWETLATMIPRILTLSMLGYSLIDSGIVGGKPDHPGNIPDEELYIRWVQVAAFLPTFQVNVLPEKYSSDTKSIVTEFRRKRKQLVMHRLRNIIDNIFQTNTPLVAPLGLHYPDDITAASINDQWIVGPDLLVAPILGKGKTSRDVYIPEGIWESQFDRSLKKGPGWISNHKIPITDVALYLKKKVH